MNIYDVQIVREGGWWSITVPSLDGIASHSKTLSKVEQISRELISTWLDVSENTFEINKVISTPKSVSQLISKSKMLEEELVNKQADILQLKKQAVSTLLEMGLTTREAAEILNISHQRVSQLAS